MWAKQKKNTNKNDQKVKWDMHAFYLGSFLIKTERAPVNWVSGKWNGTIEWTSNGFYRNQVQ